ncbi:cell division protein CrgA [soil metagenome]
MPVSRKRKKPSHTPGTTPASGPKKKGPSPVWLAPLMLTLFGIGVLWLVTFYITQNDMPLVSGLGNGNLLVGFGFIIAGFALSTQWR